MKIHRVTRNMPVGVVLGSKEFLSDGVFDFFGVKVPLFEKQTTRVTSNTSIALVLEVPLEKSRETADALRSMAKELDS